MADMDYSKLSPKVKTPKKADDREISLADIRTNVLKMAGVDESFLATKLRQSLDKLEALSGATRTQYFSSLGEVLDQRTDADNTVQLKAIDSMIGHLKDLGTLSKRQAPELPDQKDLNVVINIPWMNELRKPIEPPIIDVGENRPSV